MPRLELRLVAIHPDRRAGLAFLKLPSLVFFALVLPAFSSVLYAKYRGKREYDAYCTHYGRQFHRRWLLHPEVSDALGRPDVQALSDLTNVYRSTVDRLSRLLFETRELLGLLALALVPLAPLLLAEVHLPQLLRNLFGLAIGKLASP